MVTVLEDGQKYTGSNLSEASFFFPLFLTLSPFFFFSPSMSISPLYFTHTQQLRVLRHARVVRGLAATLRATVIELTYFELHHLLVSQHI